MLEALSQIGAFASLPKAVVQESKARTPFADPSKEPKKSVNHFDWLKILLPIEVYR